MDVDFALLNYDFSKIFFLSPYYGPLIIYLIVHIIIITIEI